MSNQNLSRKLGESAFDICFSTDENGREIRNLTHSSGNIIPANEVQRNITFSVKENDITVQIFSMEGNLRLVVSLQTLQQLHDAVTEALMATNFGKELNETAVKSLQRDIQQDIEFAERHGE